MVGSSSLSHVGQQIRAEDRRRVEALLGDLLPGRLAEHLGVHLFLPENFEAVALGVVVQAGGADEGLVAGFGREDDLLDQVAARADARDLTGTDPLRRQCVSPLGEARTIPPTPAAADIGKGPYLQWRHARPHSRQRATY
jgi:hypothetical protein